MKKLVIIFLSVLMLTGCGKKESREPNIVFSEDHYEISLPYKKALGNNYVVSKTTKYDLISIDRVLMELSMSHFAVTNSLYQPGQYLTENELNELLDFNHLNKSDKVEVDGKEYNHPYISYIYEQNYLNNSGGIKGISLALGLSQYVEYTNLSGTVKYEELDTNKVIEFGKKKAIDLLEYLYQKDELKGIKVIVALYLEPSPQGNNNGYFTHMGVTTSKDITFSEINYKQMSLSSQYILDNDINTYNNFASLITSLRNNYTDLYISGNGTYVDKKLEMVVITVNTVPKNNGELMAINQEMAKTVSNLFGVDISVRVYIKMNGDIKSMLVKEKSNSKTNIYLIGG